MASSTESKFHFNMNPGMPENIYKLFFDSLRLHARENPTSSFDLSPAVEELIAINGGVFDSAFPFFLDSYGDAIAQIALANADIGATYPRIRLYNRRSSEALLPIIREVTQQERFRRRSQNWESITGILRSVSRQNPALQDLVGNPKVTLTRNGYFTTNISQYHKARQSGAAAKAVESLKRLRPAVEDLSNKLGWRLALRPPWSFSNQHFQDVLTLGLNHYTSLLNLCNAAQEKTWLVIHGLGLNWLFAPPMSLAETTPPDEMTERLRRASRIDPHAMTEIQRTNFLFWWRTAASAVWCDSDFNEGLAIIPHMIPPFLFRPPEPEHFTIYTTAFPPAVCIFDSPVHFITCPPTIIDSINPSDLLINTISPTLQSTAYLMELLLANLHIFVNALSMGRGHHRPQWLESPANIEFINLTEALTEDYIQNAGL